VTEKAVTNWVKLVTNDICDRPCDWIQQSQTPWLEIKFVAVSVTNWDAICDWICDYNFFDTVFQALFRSDFKTDLWLTLRLNWYCDQFCDSRGSYNCDCDCQFHFFGLVLWPNLLKICQSCDCICERIWFDQKQFVAIFMAVFSIKILKHAFAM